MCVRACSLARQVGQCAGGAARKPRREGVCGAVFRVFSPLAAAPGPGAPAAAGDGSPRGAGLRLLPCHTMLLDFRRTAILCHTIVLTWGGANYRNRVIGSHGPFTLDLVFGLPRPDLSHSSSHGRVIRIGSLTLALRFGSSWPRRFNVTVRRWLERCRLLLAFLAGSIHKLALPHVHRVNLSRADAGGVG